MPFCHALRRGAPAAAVWTSAVLASVDVAVVLIGLALLTAARRPVLLVLGWCVTASLAARWHAGLL